MLHLTLSHFSVRMDMHKFTLVYTNLAAAGLANFANFTNFVRFASFGGPCSRENSTNANTQQKIGET